MPQVVTYAEVIPRVVYLMIWAVVSTWFFLDLYLMDRAHYITDLYKGVIVLAYGLVSCLFLWSYIVLCCGDPGSLEEFYRRAGVLERIKNGDIPPEFQSLPLCDRCGLPKPERTHHCGKCNQCFFRFDHHCPMLGNCVALYNTKAFILMPLYGFLVLSVCLVSVSLVHKTWVTILFVPFLLTILMFGFSYCNNVCANYTTFEGLVLRGRSDSVDYSEGRLENFRQLFGGFLGFMLPTKPPVSGFHWCANNNTAPLLARYT